MRFDWEYVKNRTTMTDLEIDTTCWEFLKHMREIDLNSIKTNDPICVEKGVLQEYHSTVRVEVVEGMEIHFMIEYEIDYYDKRGQYNVHFWYYDEDKGQELEILMMMPEEVDSNIRNEKLEKLGL